MSRPEGSMLAPPAVSIVVPFFDSERYLGACLESLLRQEGMAKPYEVLCVDNGSTDGSAAIAARAAEGFAGLTLLEEAKPGAYAARNAAIRRARAPILAFTDADCVVASDWLRSVVEGMADPATAVLLGRCRYPDEATLPLRLVGAWENAKTSYVLERCPPAHRFAYANNMAVRTSVFDEIGPFREWRRAADSELLHRLAARRPAARVRYLPAMRVTHMEFRRARDRARRLSLYTRTNSRIETFRELGPGRRLGVLAHLLRGGARRTAPA